MKQDFLDIYLTPFLGVGNFKNTSAMKVIFTVKMFKIFPKRKKNEKKFSVSDITASEDIPINWLY